MEKTALLVLGICINTIATTAQNVGIGTNNPLEKLSVGINSQFRIDVNGNITRINNVPYNFPAGQGAAGQILRNDGAGNLTWVTLPVASKPVIRVFQVTNSGADAWAIDNAADYNGSPFNLDPILVLYRGLTYQFNINAPLHPFRIAIGASPAAAYNVGVSANDIQSGTIIFTVPMDAPSQLFYYCTVHSAMNGTIEVR